MCLISKLSQIYWAEGAALTTAVMQNGCRTLTTNSKFMAKKAKGTEITQENLLRVFAGKKRAKLSAKAVLTGLGGQPQSQGKIDKLLRRMERDGILEKGGRQ